MMQKKQQLGATLIEIMIGLALSMIVTASMVGLMGNSMGSATRIIQMTQLSDELRNAMSMLARDVRRANYSAHAIYCYANASCDDITTIADVDIFDADGNQVVDENDPPGVCVIYSVDRDQDNFNAPAPGGFMLHDVDGTGVIYMWVGGAGASCNDDPLADGSEWFALTDPEYVDITELGISRALIIETIGEDDELEQRVNTLNISMEGVLQIDDQISRRIEDTVRVRNDIITSNAS